MDYIEAVISSEGDIALAAERLSHNAGHNITAYDVRQGFVKDALTHPEQLASIRALALLMNIQLMASVRDNFAGGLAEFSPKELLEALGVVSRSVAELTTLPAGGGATPAGGNNYTYIGDSAVDKLASRLSQYVIKEPTNPNLIEQRVSDD